MASSSSEDAQSLPKPLNGAADLVVSTLAGPLRLTHDGLILPLTSQNNEPEAGCSSFCSSRKTASRTSATIPHYNILNAKLSDTTLSIAYAQPTQQSVRLVTSTFSLQSIDVAAASPFLDDLLTRAYAGSQRNRRIKVIINPHGGTGKAPKIFNKYIKPILTAADCMIDEQLSTHAKHAEEIAEQLDVDSYDVVACCSGDGVPHEVFNGLARQKHPRAALCKVAVVQLPCGTGNGMSWNLFGSDDPALAALAVVKGVRIPLDLVSITQGDERRLSFLSQAVGIIAESDLATENMRWMGDARFLVGYVSRLIKQTLWPIDLAVKREIVKREDIKKAYHDHVAAAASSLDGHRSTILAPEEADATTLPPLRYGTINDPLPDQWTFEPLEHLGNFYVGNMAYMAADMKVFATSLPSDGLLDMMCVDGNIRRRRAMQLADIAGKGGLIDEEDVVYAKVSGYRLMPRQKEGYISIDGERIPFRGFQAEVHQGLGTVLCRRRGVYMAEGPVRAS